MALKKWSPVFYLAVSITAFVLACGGSEAPASTTSSAAQNATATSEPPATVAPQNTATSGPVATIALETEIVSNLPQWKYVNSGWVSPVPEDQVGPLEEEFRTFVINSQEELDAFQARAGIRISRGNTTSLGRVDFPNSILIAAYLMWRPVQGDPLSVVGFTFEPGQDGLPGRAEVKLELEDSPQGKLRPYLLAPMTMVALDRSIFPKGEPIDFVFHLDGKRRATVSSIFLDTP